MLDDDKAPGKASEVNERGALRLPERSDGGLEEKVTRATVRWPILIGGAIAILIAVPVYLFLTAGDAASPGEPEFIISLEPTSVPEPESELEEAQRPTVEELEVQVQEMLDARQEEIEDRLKVAYDERLKDLQQQLERAQTEAEAREKARLEELARMGDEAEAVERVAAEEAADPETTMAEEPEPVQMTPPKLVQHPEPPYSPMARRVGRESEVLLRVFVDAQGRVQDVQQISNKAGLGIDQAAMEAAREAQYQPGTADGMPKAMWTIMRYTARLAPTAADQDTVQAQPPGGEGRVPVEEVEAISTVASEPAIENNAPTNTQNASRHSAQPPGLPASAANPEHGLLRAWKQLKEGRIGYQPERTMRQGKREVVRVRIAEGERLEVSTGFSGNDAVAVEEVQVSGVMGAELIADERDFLIDPLSTGNQALVGEHVDWAWWVTPLRSGELELTLRITAKIESEGSDEYTDMLLKTAQIYATANPKFKMGRFVGEHWKWLFGSPIVLGILTWIGKATQRKKKQKAAGF